MKVAKILKGKTVCPTVSLCIAPGSKQVLNMLAMNGALGDMIGAGARLLESACGPCIGMGQSPNSGGISLRTFNPVSYTHLSRTLCQSGWLSTTTLNPWLSSKRVMMAAPKDG